MKIKILIPIFNDWESILKLLENINSEIINLNHEFTVIIVDDASTIKPPTFENKYDKIITFAFQRRFRQELINGKIDKECLLISKKLAKS